MMNVEGRLRPHLVKVGLVLAGFVLGGLVFGIRACSESDPHADHAPVAGEREAEIWTCSMHPQIRQPEPGQCPICGMDLIPVSSGDAAGEAGENRVVLSDRAKALARLRTTTVRRRSDASARLRLLGRIEPNETTLKTVTAWTGGRIDDLHVNVTGERVRAGQVIATLYSPEVFSAHQDLLVAKRQVDRMADSPASSLQAAEAALDAARQRLRLLGVPDDALARMETQPNPTRSVAIRTPFSGTVIERMATEGAYVSTGTPLYKIANLSTLWVQLDAYESDLSRLRVGQDVRVSVEALPDEIFEGKITFIDPTVDRSRRTAQVRVEVDNREGRLRPGMFAEAIVETGAASSDASPLVVPKTAPLFTGRRAIVYVEVSANDRIAYEPRTVRLGPRLGELYPVVAGLSEGERVVTRGAFAIDADLQIRGGASMMSAPDDGEAEAGDVAIALPSAERAKLAPVVRGYLAIQEALAADALGPARKAADEMSKAIAAASITRPTEAVAAWSESARALRGHASHVARADDLEGARTAFEALSGGIRELLARFGNPLDHPLHVAFCPMASGSRGASWVQKGREIENAYFGASMRTCGEVQNEVEPGDFLRAEARGERGP